AVAVGGGEVLDAFEQARVTSGAYLRVAEFAMRAGLDFAALLHGHGEHAVADAEHRNAEVPHRLRRAEVPRLVGAGGAAAEDDALRRELAHEGVADVVGMDLAVHVRLPHAPGDELRNLRAEIQDQNPGVCGTIGYCDRRRVGGARRRAPVIQRGNWALPW